MTHGFPPGIAGCEQLDAHAGTVDVGPDGEGAKVLRCYPQRHHVLPRTGRREREERCCELGCEGLLKGWLERGSGRGWQERGGGGRRVDSERGWHGEDRARFGGSLRTMPFQPSNRQRAIETGRLRNLGSLARSDHRHCRNRRHTGSPTPSGSQRSYARIGGSLRTMPFQPSNRQRSPDMDRRVSGEVLSTWNRSNRTIRIRFDGLLRNRRYEPSNGQRAIETARLRNLGSLARSNNRHCRNRRHTGSPTPSGTLRSNNRHCRNRRHTGSPTPSGTLRSNNRHCRNRRHASTRCTTGTRSYVRLKLARFGGSLQTTPFQPSIRQ